MFLDMISHTNIFLASRVVSLKENRLALKEPYQIDQIGLSDSIKNLRRALRRQKGRGTSIALSDQIRSAYQIL